MVLDAMEDRVGQIQEEEEIFDIPLLDRHLGKRDADVQTRVVSREEILQQREEMLQQEIMQQNMAENGDDDDGMDEDEEDNAYDYSTAFFQ